jgi:hypothetical protein
MISSALFWHVDVKISVTSPRCLVPITIVDLPDLKLAADYENSTIRKRIDDEIDRHDAAILFVVDGSMGLDFVRSGVQKTIQRSASCVERSLIVFTMLDKANFAVKPDALMKACAEIHKSLNVPATCCLYEFPQTVLDPLDKLVSAVMKHQIGDLLTEIQAATKRLVPISNDPLGLLANYANLHMEAVLALPAWEESKNWGKLASLQFVVSWRAVLQS